MSCRLSCLGVEEVSVSFSRGLVTAEPSGSSGLLRFCRLAVGDQVSGSWQVPAVLSLCPGSDVAVSVDVSHFSGLGGSSSLPVECDHCLDI